MPWLWTTSRDSERILFLVFESFGLYALNLVTQIPRSEAAHGWWNWSCWPHLGDFIVYSQVRLSAPFSSFLKTPFQGWRLGRGERVGYRDGSLGRVCWTSKHKVRTSFEITCYKQHGCCNRPKIFSWSLMLVMCQGGLGDPPAGGDGGQGRRQDRDRRVHCDALYTGWIMRTHDHALHNGRLVWSCQCWWL